MTLQLLAWPEIYRKGDARDPRQAGGRPRRALRSSGADFLLILAQILVLDVVFSLDSVITGVGMARLVPVMVVAMVISVAVSFLLSVMSCSPLRLAAVCGSRPAVLRLASSPMCRRCPEPRRGNRRHYRSASRQLERGRGVTSPYLEESDGACDGCVCDELLSSRLPRSLGCVRRHDCRLRDLVTAPALVAQRARTSILEPCSESA